MYSDKHVLPAKDEKSLKKMQYSGSLAGNYSDRDVMKIAKCNMTVVNQGRYDIIVVVIYCTYLQQQQNIQRYMSQVL
jgi:hypothetical protein